VSESSTPTLSFIDDVSIVAPMSTHTCTIVVSGNGAVCGQPAVASFTAKRSGVTYFECADHCAGVHEPVGHVPAHPPTRTSKPFVLVAAGVIVGYADSAGPAVAKRAAKLGAAIVPVAR